MVAAATLQFDSGAVMGKEAAEEAGEGELRESLIGWKHSVNKESSSRDATSLSDGPTSGVSGEGVGGSVNPKEPLLGSTAIGRLRSRAALDTILCGLFDRFSTVGFG